MIDDKFSICIQMCDSNGKKIHENITYKKFARTIVTRVAL